MQLAARQNYLETEIMTATPQKLQLMLIDAAIRSGERAKQYWEENKDDEASGALIHAQEIVGELLAGLNREVDSQLSQKVASVYLFIFRSLMEATHDRDEEKLQDAMRVLSVERETWRQVCEVCDETQLPEGAQQPEAPQLPEATAPPQLEDQTPEMPSGGFSLEA
jgi:flagellar protein FliS